MPSPPLPPPPLDTGLPQKDGKPSPVWARWFQQLWSKQRECCEDGGGGGGGGVSLSNDAPQNIGSTSAGVGTEASRDDHVHAHGSQAGGALHSVAVASGAAGFLSGSDKSKLDGISAGAAALTSSSPADVGTTAVGVASTAARADHVHAHGNQTGGTLHAVAVGGVSAGFVSAADQTKLDNLITIGQVLAISRGWAIP